MKRLLVTLLIVGFVCLAVKVWATAVNETGDLSARPITLYGKTSGGTLLPFQVDANGVLQTS